MISDKNVSPNQTELGNVSNGETAKKTESVPVESDKDEEQKSENDSEAAKV